MPEFPKTKPWWVSIAAWERFQRTRPRGTKGNILYDEYQRFGGPLNLQNFLRQGLPNPPTALTPRAVAALERTGGVPAGVNIAEPPTPGQITPTQRIAVDPQREAARVDLGGGQLGFQSFSEAFSSLPNENWEVYKNDFGRFDVRRKQAAAPPPTGLTPFQEQQLDLQQQRLEFEQRPPEITPFQQQQFDVQQQQFGQQQAQFQAQLQFQQEQARRAVEGQERQFRSQLAANPISWLQYASYTGETPVVQPWMVPLGFQNTGGTTQAGQPIPGFQGQTGQQQIQTFANLPQLTKPSAQLQARWGPTAQAQYLGYRQARTGERPEESLFRLGSGRAPTGRFGGFSSFR